jgi:4-carboxymuconolactone decarboxylase
MSITSAAQANHDELFPDHQSTLKVTDPEFVELFDNFAFDEVIAYGNLATQTRLKVILASLIAMQTVNEYKVMLGGAERGRHPGGGEGDRLPGRAVRRHRASLRLPARHERDPPKPGRDAAARGSVHHDPQTRHRDGLALQKSIFGETIDAMYASSAENQLHIRQYLSANCFGDYYNWTGLDIPTRELLTFAMILSMGGCEPQLRGHVQGNLNVGNDKAALLAVVTQLLPYVGYPRALNAISCLNEVIPQPSQPGRRHQTRQPQAREEADRQRRGDPTRAAPHRRREPTADRIPTPRRHDALVCDDLGCAGGNDLQARSAYGPANPWLRRANKSGAGRIRAGGIERDTTFTEAASQAHAAIDAARQAKYT